MPVRRAAAGGRIPLLPRILGYGGAVLLVVAAVAVLVAPLLGGGAGERTGAAPTTAGDGRAVPPGEPTLPGGAPGPTGPAMPTSPSATPAPPGPGDQAGGGPPGPVGPGSGPGRDRRAQPCAAATASYREAAGGLRVTVRVKGGGLVLATAYTRGGGEEVRRGTDRGAPVVLDFAGVTHARLERVNVYTIAASGTIENCDAPAAG